MKILHTADNHLGVRQYGLLARLEDFTDAVRDVAETAKRQNVDVVVFGGDQFHSTHPPAQAVRDMQTIVADLQHAGIATLGIEGNHDSTGDDWLSVCGITPLEQYTGAHPVIQRLPDGHTIFGINSAPPTIFREKIKQLRDHLNESGEKLTVLVIHMPLRDIWNKGGGLDKTALSAAEIKEQLPAVPLVLMGDIHSASETEIDGTWFVYPGSTELTASDEPRNKSCELVELQDDKLALSTCPVKTRPFVDFLVESDEDIEALPGRIKAASSDKSAMALITYGRGVRGATQRIAAVLGDKHLYRMLPARQGLMGEAETTSVELASFDRNAAINSLKRVLEESFPLGKEDEKTLIMQFLDAPDKVADTAAGYVKSKGVDL